MTFRKSLTVIVKKVIQNIYNSSVIMHFLKNLLREMLQNYLLLR